jgi:Cu+-exporting ATPase
VGTAAFLREVGTNGVAQLEERASSVRTAGETVLYVALDSEAAGLLTVADRLKPNAAAAVAELKAMGLDVRMLTGDDRSVATAVAHAAGVTSVEAGMTPEGKYTTVSSLRASGVSVAMVGDGINDAAALAAADCGFAMGNGTDVAMASAGITLLRGDLDAVARAVRLSRAVMRNIRQNLWFAFAYNGLGIAFACGLFYPAFGWQLSPMVAGAAMSLSSVSVILNALRLRGVNLSERQH